MSIDGALSVLLWIVVIFAIAYVAHWVITTYFPEPIRTPALLIVGVILLILVVSMLVGGGSGPQVFPLRR